MNQGHIKGYKMFEGIDLISNPAMSQDQAVTENAETAMDMETTSDEDGAAVCAVLEYKLQKKTRKVRKLKRELEKEARWKKIDRIFWFMFGYGACLLFYSICETASKMAIGMVP